MKKILIIGASLVSLSACTTTERSAAVGAGVGATVGAVTTGSVLGTAVGAGLGAVAGAAIGKVADRPGECYYRDARTNRTFIAACPR